MIDAIDKGFKGAENKEQKLKIKELKTNKAEYTALVAPSRPKSESVTDRPTDGRTDQPTDGHTLL